MMILWGLLGLLFIGAQVYMYTRASAKEATFGRGLFFFISSILLWSMYIGIGFYMFLEFLRGQM
jgi:heme/copper-type cytochrome/quinol oxidase subunit 3